ncbi:TetR/AcrR family transcriptional regulator [Peterkaempfera bronchialis]|uniref:TetR/AcrR family transcriptional regulator n=1 Tax=Peterkaempfera bronchialis TaxID=2126346 RepID=UPI003C2C7537
MTTTPPRAAPGRPRDQQVDRRVADAAVEVFGEHGWTGFTIDAVARRAGVGKASVYLRWSSKEDLLTEALTLRLCPVRDVDTGTVRGDLVQLVEQMVGLYSGEHGSAALRLGLEARFIPQLTARYEEMTSAQIRTARDMVRRGIHRGELPETISVTFLLEALCGGAMNHALTARASGRTSRPRTDADFAKRFVDFVLTPVLVDPRAD